jgi:hypothetical protein
MYSQASRNAGLAYEKKVNEEIARVYGDLASFQVKVDTGFIDALVALPTPIIIEAKLTQTAEAFHQLQRYARCFPRPTIRAVVTRTVDRNVQTPIPPTYLRTIAELQSAEPGYYVIPLVFARR